METIRWGVACNIYDPEVQKESLFVKHSVIIIIAQMSLQKVG